MALEFETEVRIEEDFSDYTLRQKLDLIIAILKGQTWDFEGVDTVSYEPPDYP
jgi:hypothetical protein